MLSQKKCLNFLHCQRLKMKCNKWVKLQVQDWLWQIKWRSLNTWHQPKMLWWQLEQILNLLLLLRHNLKLIQVDQEMLWFLALPHHHLQKLKVYQSPHQSLKTQLFLPYLKAYLNRLLQLPVQHRNKPKISHKQQ